MLWPIYDLLTTAVTPLALPFFALHPRIRADLAQRVGALSEPPRGAVWFHGASAGDVNALLPLALAWRARGAAAALSSFTRSGAQLLAREAPADVYRFEAPLDASFAVRRTLAALCPRALVLEHLELWPSLWRVAVDRRVPIALVNARLSAASARRYRALPSLFLTPLRAAQMVAAVTPADAQRFVDLGVDPRRVWVAEQSTKYARPPAAAPAFRRPCIVLGSVHEREEALIFPAARSLMEGEIKVVVAPRYPHRAAAVVRRLAELGIRARRSSQARGEAGEGAGVEVLDAMGELPRAYEGATVAFIGGSLDGRGGHNVLEPARAGCAVVTGPDVQACGRELAVLRRCGAAAVEGDARGVARCLGEWSRYDARRAASAHRAAMIVADGARRTVRTITSWLSGSI